MELALGSRYELVSMKKCHELGITMPVRLVRDLGIGVYHGRETLTSVARVAPNFVEPGERKSDFATVPSKQDRLDV